MTVERRPIGVTILAVLYLAGGALWLVQLFTGGGGFGLVSIAVAAILLAVAYGMWALKPWAWTVGLVLSVLNIISALPSFGQTATQLASSIAWIALSVVTIWYLYSPPVRAAFGRG